MTQYKDLADSDEMMVHRHDMVLVPRRWAAFACAHALAWSTYPFKDASRKMVPDEPGVYAFLITPGIAGDLQVAYLMYIGKTDRTLRERFGEYLLETKHDRIRPKLLRVLPRYPENLTFACASLPAGVVPGDVESALIEAFIPPCNDQLPATVRRARKAF